MELSCQRLREFMRKESQVKMLSIIQEQLLSLDLEQLLQDHYSVTLVQKPSRKILIMQQNLSKIMQEIQIILIKLQSNREILFFILTQFLLGLRILSLDKEKEQERSRLQQDNKLKSLLQTVHRFSLTKERHWLQDQSFTET